MLSVLFWNVNRRFREDRCASLVRTFAPTLLVLAECPDLSAVESTVTALDPTNPWSLLPTASKCRVRVFSRLPAANWPVVEEGRRYAIHRLELPSAEEMLVVSVHLRSKLNSPEPEQDAELRRLAARINAAELARGHTRTLVIGDLNAHPFQPGVYAADGLHAVMTREQAQKGQRRVGGTASRFFYNPMWRFFGETPAGPPGTYHWPGSGVNASLFWHMLDQVLVRPALLPLLPTDGVQIVTHDGTMSLAKPFQKPDPDVGSDHFPILVRLNYPGV